MGFILPEGVETRTLSRKGKGAAKKGIWDSSIERALEDLDLGIAEAKGRYHGEGGAASTDNPVASLKKGDKKNPHTRPFASSCWKPQMVAIYETVDGKKKKVGDKPKIDAIENEELVIVHLKCKAAFIPIFNGEEAIQIFARDLVRTLEALKVHVAQLKKSTGNTDGNQWHDHAVRQSYPRKDKATSINDKGISNKYAHCMEQDMWVEIAKVERSSTYPSVPF
jgi:hypothetical protein